MSSPGNGVVYTETVVHSPTPQYLNDVPYQLAIIELESGGKLTGRIDGEEGVGACQRARPNGWSTW